MNVGNRVFAHHYDAWHLACDFPLHAHERVPATYCPALPPVGGMIHFERAIFGDRMVQRDDCWKEFFDFQDSGTEALVVVDEIEVANTIGQGTVGTDAESKRFTEGALEELCRLHDVRPVGQLPIGRETPGVMVIEDVEARQLMHHDTRVDYGVRLATKDFDVMTEVDQGFGEVSGVDALTAHVGLSPIGQVSNAQRAVWIVRRRHIRMSLPIGNHGSPGCCATHW